MGMERNVFVKSFFDVQYSVGNLVLWELYGEGTL